MHTTKGGRLVPLQVLDEIFNCLHRAELGSGAESALDPQLPQRTRIRVAPATAGSSAETPGPAVSRPERTLIQDVFGLEVQVCLARTCMHATSQNYQSLRPNHAARHTRQ